jgi:hypothetical protein
MLVSTLHPEACVPSIRPVGFWRTFDTLSTGKALMVVWRSLAGSDFPSLHPFLRPTPGHSFTYPCMGMPWCECDHEVTDDPLWDQVAVCTCGDCEPFPLTREQTMLHSFNRRAFGEALRHALGFAPPLSFAQLSQRQSGSALNSQLLAIGSYQPLHAPVYFYAPTSAAALSAQVNAMLAGNAGPFLLLTPTSTWITPQVLNTLGAAGCAHAALSTLLNHTALATPKRSEGRSGLSTICPATAERSVIHHLSPDCGPQREQLSAILRAWAAAGARHPGPALIEGLYSEMDAFRRDYLELRSAKQRLEKMQADGVFAFTQKVDATSFKVLCAILAQGDVSKAARTLGIGDPMMRKLLKQWQTRGAAYQAMLELVRWRKKVGRKKTVPLNDSILHEKADTTDYPALLSDVLDGLLSMTETNWQDLAEELARLLRPALSETQHPGIAQRTPVRKT